ncbi:hypothetical protein MHBO_004082, partial [Bonamia ostreae]
FVKKRKTQILKKNVQQVNVVLRQEHVIQIVTATIVNHADSEYKQTTLVVLVVNKFTNCVLFGGVFVHPFLMPRKGYYRGIFMEDEIDKKSSKDLSEEERLIEEEHQKELAEIAGWYDWINREI